MEDSSPAGEEMPARSASSQDQAIYSKQLLYWTSSRLRALPRGGHRPTAWSQLLALPASAYQGRIWSNKGLGAPRSFAQIKSLYNSPTPAASQFSSSETAIERQSSPQSRGKGEAFWSYLSNYSGAELDFGETSGVGTTDVLSNPEVRVCPSLVVKSMHSSACQGVKLRSPICSSSFGHDLLKGPPPNHPCIPPFLFDEGWIFVEKPRNSTALREDFCHSVEWRAGSGPSIGDKVSLSTPEGIVMQDFPKRKNGTHGDWVEDLSSDLNSESLQFQWLTDKMKECGEAVGLSVNNSKKGWGDLIAFAHGREKENRTALALVK